MEVSTERLREIRSKIQTELDRSVHACVAEAWANGERELLAIIDLVLAQREQKVACVELKKTETGQYWFDTGGMRVWDMPLGKYYAAPPASQLRDKCAELVREWRDEAADLRANDHPAAAEAIEDCTSAVATLLESTP